jgi:type IX secretion system PorP/SprF family membrane protein
MKPLFINLIIFFILLCCEKIVSQQTILFNNYYIDPLQLNIAYADPEDFSVNAHVRAQWIGITKAPKSIQLNSQYKLDKKTKIALRVNSQTQGLLNTTSVLVGYGYKFKVSKSTNVHLGLGLGWTNASLKTGKAIVKDYDDLSLNNGTTQKSNGLDAEFGGMLINENIKAGISILHLYNSNPDFTLLGSYKRKPQLNAQFSYIFNKGERIEIEPWLLNRYTMKGDNVIEGLIHVKYDKNYTVGLGYRSFYGPMFVFSIVADDFKFGYSFDFVLGKNSTSMGSSHQIAIGYCFSKEGKYRLK